ncbi:MAG: ABC transporter permease [Chloroflexota bacterium]|nr:ABC transporter permease [Chloroflexota bacterium]
MAAIETALGAPLAGDGLTPYGEVFDRGYHHYDGPRLGRRGAFSALVLYSIQRAMGIKKSWSAKIIPFLLYLAVTVPVGISLGIRVFLPTANILDYPEFFGIIFILEGIFVATITPEMLCGDRRENVLQLYFSRAITRLDYLVAKLVATAILTLTMTVVPALLLWLGRQFLADQPFQAMANNTGDLWRIGVAGFTIAAYLGSIGLLVSSFTGRKSIAVAVIIVGFIITESLAGALAAAIRRGTESMNDQWVLLLSPSSTAAGLVGRLFNEPGLGVEQPLWVIFAVMCGVVLASLSLMYWRYVPNE